MSHHVTTYSGMSHYRKVGVTMIDRRRWRQEFLLNGMFHVMEEYGDRNNEEIEPCANVRNASKQTDDGLYCYQVSFILHNGLPPAGMDISHRCRCPKKSDVTCCCNPNHMFLQRHDANRRNAKCHNSIVKAWNKKIAKRRRQGLSGFKGPILSTLSDCRTNGKCFINFGKNTTVNNTARIYVLRL